MTEESPSPFCHIVIPAPDLERAREFYSRVFGWEVIPGVPGPDYWFFESGNVAGGFSARATPQAKGVVLVLQVPDLDEAVARIRAGGGVVTQEPGEIGEASPGRDAYFLDPNGNAMGVYCGSGDS